MKEAYLHYVWKTKQFDRTSLQTTEGESVEIIYPGDYNRDSGPDFFNAKLKIGGQLWSGNVEIHVKASDWNRHRHQEDAAYNSVILHVVHDADAPAVTQHGVTLPTVELRPRIDRESYVRYLRLYSDKTPVPCSNQLSGIPQILVTNWLSRLMVERLERKVRLLQMELENSGWDWEETFYRHLARQFGMKVNAEPFQWLAAAAPLKIVGRQGENRLQTEALLFGQSGLLPEKQIDSYVKQLTREYVHLQHKYHIRPMAAQRWKFLRLRPVNFPTLRISQLAELLCRHPRLFSICIEENLPQQELRKLLDVPASGYWTTHYRFGKLSIPRTKRLGAQAVEAVVINTIVPFKFLWGKEKGNLLVQEEALRLLEELSAESNKITREWNERGVIAVTAGESQALLELTGNYCQKKKCLQCDIGMRLLER